MNSEFYESDRLLSEYLLFHYGKPEDVLPYDFGPRDALDYPVRVVRECLQIARLPLRPKALDLGCAVGGSTFELARRCDEVIGVDASKRFVEAAQVLKTEGQKVMEVVEEGILTRKTAARVPRGIDRSRVSFEVGNALELRRELTGFDVVLMSNLLDRLPDPESCLKGMFSRMNPGGQLIVATPCTWMETFTPRDKWLGGFERDGRRIHTGERLFEILESHFEFVGKRDIPFLIREHARKFQWSVSLATIWTRWG